MILIIFLVLPSLSNFLLLTIAVACAAWKEERIYFVKLLKHKKNQLIPNGVCITEEKRMEKGNEHKEGKRHINSKISYKSCLWDFFLALKYTIFLKSNGNLKKNSKKKHKNNLTFCSIFWTRHFTFILWDGK